MKQELISADEVDVVYDRKHLVWTQRAGTTSRVKRRMRRRLRHETRAELGHALRRRDFLAV